MAIAIEKKYREAKDEGSAVASAARRFVLSAVLSVGATILVRKLKGRKHEEQVEEGEEAQAGHPKKPRTVGQEQNIVFVIMPFAFMLDGVRFFAEMRRARRERTSQEHEQGHAHIDADEGSYEQMRA